MYSHLDTQRNGAHKHMLKLPKLSQNVICLFTMWFVSSICCSDGKMTNTGGFQSWSIQQLNCVTKGPGCLSLHCGMLNGGFTSWGWLLSWSEGGMTLSRVYTRYGKVRNQKAAIIYDVCFLRVSRNILEDHLMSLTSQDWGSQQYF
jgi:hypothetical protein